MPTLTFALTCTDGSTTPALPANAPWINAITAGGEPPLLNVSVPASSTNLEYTFSLVIAKLKAIIIVNTGTLLHLYTNDASSGSPQDTFIFPTGGGVFFWHNALINAAAPFAGNVSALYVTNPSGSVAGNLIIQGIVDPLT